MGERRASPAPMMAIAAPGVQLVKRAWPVVPAGLAVVFATQRLFSSLFYAQFDVARAEVGLGALDGFVEGVVVFVLTFVVVNVAMYYLFVELVVRQVQHDLNSIRTWWGRRHGVVVERKAVTGLKESSRRRVLAVLGTVFAVLFLLLMPFVWMLREVDAVRQGHNAGGFPVVSWHAHRTSIAWIGTIPPSMEPIAQHCLMYLGSSSGVTVLYDVDAGATVRLPTSTIALTSAPTGACSDTP